MPGINRFCVMATLQAARASLLGLDADEAYSWGLNRAIFYAAAKHGFKGGGGSGGGGGTGTKSEAESVFHLGSDMAFRKVVNGKSVFTIGGKLQTSSDFQRQVASRFGDKFDAAWDEALDLLEHYDRALLSSPESFYGEVYRPNRDVLVERWAALAGPGETGKSAKRLKK